MRLQAFYSKMLGFVFLSGSALLILHLHALQSLFGISPIYASEGLTATVSSH